MKVILAAGEAALFRQKRRQDVSAAAADGIDPAEAAAAAAYAAAADAEIEAMPDVDDFTTWQPHTWGAVDYDKIRSPLTPCGASALFGATWRWQ